MRLRSVAMWPGPAVLQQSSGYAPWSVRRSAARGVDELTVIPRMRDFRAGIPGSLRDRWAEFDPYFADQYPRTVTPWCGGGPVLTVSIGGARSALRGYASCLLRARRSRRWVRSYRPRAPGPTRIDDDHVAIHHAKTYHRQAVGAERCSPTRGVSTVAKGKRTFQPNNRRRARVHGFRLRMRTRAGRAIVSARRSKGRKSLTA